MMNRFIAVFVLVLSSMVTYSQQLKVDALSCEYKSNPLGLDILQPKLSWKLQAENRNTSQTHFQILVSDNLKDLQANKGNVWDSKKIASNQSVNIIYSGTKLISTKKYYWKVKVWDNHNLSVWSETAYWQMGLLSKADWKNAQWIAYDKIADSNVNILPVDGKKDTFKENNILPIFRKSVNVIKTVKSATLFISGLGHFECSLNGKKVGDDFLAPGWTKYDKEALYVTYDLTNSIKTGENVFGVMLGNGFYYIPPVSGRYRKLKVAFGYPKMICRLAIEYTDGTKTDVVSNSSWKTAPSPITFSSIFGGEDYNANLEQKGWNLPKFNDSNWKSALPVDGPELNAQKEEPIQIFDRFAAKTITEVANKDWIYDFGQNSSAIIELKVSGKKGDTIRITPAELLKEDGLVTQKNIGGPSYFNYILKGDGIETWRPKFMYTGFRYLQVKGGVPKGKNNPSNKAVIEDLKALHIRNAATTVGSFSSSNELFNQTFDLINWSVKSNMMSVFTDCPHREKLGWLEQLHLMGSSISYNYDVAPLFKKALQDMKNSQTADGLIPEIAPEYVKFEWGGDMFRDSPEWGSSSILLPWYLYKWYGDQQAMVDYYPMMQRYISYLKTKANNHILSQGLGDWYDLGPNAPGVSQLTPMGVTGTAIYYYDLKTLAKIATKIGKTQDAETYEKLAVEVKKAFNHKFFNAETKQYASGSQTANAMAVYLGLVNEKDKKAVVENIIKDIRNRDNSLTAGDIGYRYLLRVLEDEGRSDVIFDMNSRADKPGYGMQLAKGATALTESWAALTTVSNNHLMLGHLMEWFYSGVGGIRQDEESIAWNKIKIEPEIVGDLTSANTSYNSPYGTIASNWKKIGNVFELEVTIPANTNAEIYIPFRTNQTLTESNQKIEKFGLETNRAIVKIGSGTYLFKVQ
ncbi:family 78 glycoside hydrolase catalytic domain [Pedobacter cryotolerans]|nr:family 78 glycoside hydrolase catalytic domain [Pedobacter cryotolerans]